MAPATRLAVAAIRILPWVAPEAATPSTRLDVDTIPSFAPSTAARNQPMLFSRCLSLRCTVISALRTFAHVPAVLLQILGQIARAHAAQLVAGNRIIDEMRIGQVQVRHNILEFLQRPPLPEPGIA